jgi:hypothetical protein
MHLLERAASLVRSASEPAVSTLPIVGATPVPAHGSSIQGRCALPIPAPRSPAARLPPGSPCRAWSRVPSPRAPHPSWLAGWRRGHESRPFGATARPSPQACPPPRPPCTGRSRWRQTAIQAERETVTERRFQARRCGREAERWSTPPPAIPTDCRTPTPPTYAGVTRRPPLVSETAPRALSWSVAGLGELCCRGRLAARLICMLPSRQGARGPADGARQNNRNANEPWGRLQRRR